MIIDEVIFGIFYMNILLQLPFLLVNFGCVIFLSFRFFSLDLEFWLGLGFDSAYWKTLLTVSSQKFK